METRVIFLNTCIEWRTLQLPRSNRLIPEIFLHFPKFLSWAFLSVLSQASSEDLSVLVGDMDRSKGSRDEVADTNIRHIITSLKSYDSYSHSIVLGGLDETSKTTRFTPFTSLMIRFDITPKSS